VTTRATEETIESAARQAGARTRKIVDAVVIALFTSGLGLGVGAGFVPDRVQRPIVYTAIVFGAMSIVTLAFGRRSAVVGAIGLYVVLVGVGSVLQTQEPRPSGALIAIAIGTIVAAGIALFASVRKGRRSRELDRMLFTEATSVAFFVTMLSAVTYALLESWVDAPKLSMWFVWTVGMGAWIVSATTFKRRYS
jgi:hypothetical protein